MNPLACCTILFMVLQGAHAQLDKFAPLSGLSCAHVRCLPPTVCRMIEPCPTCPLVPRCVPLDFVIGDADKQCQVANYLHAVLVKDPLGRTSYTPLQCIAQRVNFNCVCPSGSACVTNSKGVGVCCEGKPRISNPFDKPGDCPISNIPICGVIFCDNDYDCPGDQKCCPGCGYLCTRPVNTSDHCGYRSCPVGQICVYRQRYCPQGKQCLQALIPTCIYPGCEKCRDNQYCLGTREPHRCVLYPNDECGGCEEGYVCRKSAFSCGKPNCPMYKCYPA